MALYPLQAQLPAGQFDVLDAYASLIKGGEVGTLFEAARTNTVSEKSAYDVKDGYDYTLLRAAVAPRVNSSSVRPLWLLDEGIKGYGTLFGSIIGTPVGLCTGKGSASSCSSTLGPHTTAGSGKVTCWHMPGIYAISADAVDTTASTGLVMSNINAIPGAIIKPLPTGVLTLTNGVGAVNVTVARFIEFETSPFLVTTPPSLVGATEVVERVVINYFVE
ncbi:MAG: hypothetical protein WC516_08355 [Patescibacteria group bacterium]|jgi:hypothetical protein